MAFGLTIYPCTHLPVYPFRPQRGRVCKYSPV